MEEDEEQEAEKDWDAMRQPESWLLDNGHFADVTVSCGPRSWKLHKAILARESTVWREKFLDPLETAATTTITRPSPLKPKPEVKAVEKLAQLSFQLSKSIQQIDE